MNDTWLLPITQRRIVIGNNSDGNKLLGFRCGYGKLGHVPRPIATIGGRFCRPTLLSRARDGSQTNSDARAFFSVSHCPASRAARSAGTEQGFRFNGQSDGAERGLSKEDT
ncbi:hypothetical protein VTN96DRAFT_918 [Rasamsonia emersonii]